MKCLKCKKNNIPKRNKYFCSKKCKFHFNETKIKIGISNTAKKNGMWKGKKAGLDAIHIWVNKRMKKPKKCPNCGKIRKLDAANISQKYKRNPNDFEYLCRKCHMLKDGRLQKMIERNKKGRIKPFKKRCEICKKWFKPWNIKSNCCSLSCNSRKANIIRWKIKS